MGSIGRWLRHNVLNPVKTIVGKTPIGIAIEAVVPGAFNPEVNLFASPTAPAAVIPEAAPAAVIQAVATPQALPRVASGRTVKIPVEMLEALVAEARAAGQLRRNLAALRASQSLPPVT